jgi:hypothetical protein
MMKKLARKATDNVVGGTGMANITGIDIEGVAIPAHFDA